MSSIAVRVVRRFLAKDSDFLASYDAIWESKRLINNVKYAGSVRVIVDSEKKPSEKTWLDVNREVEVTLTVELPTSGRPYAYVNRIDTFRNKGKGYASEVLSLVLGKIHAKEVRAYIEHGNGSSERLFSKLGFKIIERKDQGNVWARD